MKTIILMILVVLSSFVVAHEEDLFAEAEEIINSKISCGQLSEAQLEAVGEYYMEQMHPGELHERMDAMMGGEGSEQLKQIHINLARSFYCGEHGAMPRNMMNTMMGRGGLSMMNYGMKGYGSYGSFLNVLYFILLIGLIILIYLWIIKWWKGTTGRGGKNR